MKYFVKIIEHEDEEKILNAVSLPGGYIYLFKGVLDEVDNDDELASVIAHEVGHITSRHSIKRLQGSHGALLLQLLSIGAGGRVAGGVGLTLDALFTNYSQQDEFEADELSIKYLKKGRL